MQYRDISEALVQYRSSALPYVVTLLQTGSREMFTTLHGRHSTQEEAERSVWGNITVGITQKQNVYPANCTVLGPTIAWLLQHSMT